jgi:hypothetical protein
MIKGSRKLILVVDHSKFGMSASVMLGGFESIDQLFTDKPPPLALRNILKKKKTQLIKISK